MAVWRVLRHTHSYVVGAALRRPVLRQKVYVPEGAVSSARATSASTCAGVVDDP